MLYADVAYPRGKETIIVRHTMHSSQFSLAYIIVRLHKIFI